MGEGTLTLLCTGDLHLGRHPTRIPARLDGPEFSPRSVWRDVVRDAIDREVDAVVLTGDVADRENRYFEAYGAFEAGVIDLTEAGIPVVAVAGNHDAEYLPRMVEDIGVDDLHLLGAGGTWERWTLERDGDPVAHFEGWSFPRQHVSSSPLATYDLSERHDAPQIGVLHADLDSPRSRYAPVSASALRNTPEACWLLGHVHAPEVRIESDPLTLYPGSPQALDPGERGVHGPWLVTLESDGSVDATHRPLGTVCYDALDVDVSDAVDLHAAGSSITTAIRQYVEEKLDAQTTSVFLPRIRLTGRTPAHVQLVDGRETLEEQVATKHDTIDVHVDSVVVDTRPDVDLETLSTGDGPVSYLASLLLALEGGEPNGPYEQLVDDAQNAMEEAYRATPYNLLRRETGVTPPDRDDAVETIEREARVLLDTLLRQTEDR